MNAVDGQFFDIFNITITISVMCADVIADYMKQKLILD